MISTPSMIAMNTFSRQTVHDLLAQPGPKHHDRPRCKANQHVSPFDVADYGLNRLVPTVEQQPLDVMARPVTPPA